MPQTVKIGQNKRNVKPATPPVTSVWGPRDGVNRAVRVGASGIHGRGVYAREALPARRKIGELSGTLVPIADLRPRIERLAVIYYIELSRRYALDCSQGNAFKHLNHHCEPNCYLRVIRRRVEVYARRDIAAGEELFVDYGLTPHPGGMVCHCGAPRCRGRL